MSTKAFHELYAGIGVVLLSIIGYFFIIPVGIVVPEGVDIRALSPDFWPRIVVIALGLSGLSLLAQGLAGTGILARRKSIAGAEKTSRTTEAASDKLSLGKAALRVVVFVTALFAIYFTIPHIGMVAATMPAIVFMAWYAGEERWRIILSLAILVPLILYFFFVYVANVPIPNGIFETLG